jgi:hypothetical protein
MNDDEDEDDDDDVRTFEKLNEQSKSKRERHTLGLFRIRRLPSLNCWSFLDLIASNSLVKMAL